MPFPTRPSRLRRRSLVGRPRLLRPHRRRLHARPPHYMHTPSPAPQRSAILIHEKSPLLVATPAPDHPRSGLLAPVRLRLELRPWPAVGSTGDPWESFLVTASFWASILYGDYIIRWAGPLVVVLVLILAMYARRYLLLSSNAWTGQKGAKPHRRGESASQLHSLEDIVDTLNEFNSKCNILLEPFLDRRNSCRRRPPPLPPRRSQP